MEEFYFYTKGLTVGYHGVPLIKDIELCLKKGEIMTLIGPNGAGKTTILKSIIRQLKPLGGVACLDGSSMEKLTGKELSQKLSVVLTERVRPEMMTCKDVVATGRYPYTGKFGILSEKDWAIVQESMELVHIEELAERDFSKTSDGQKQRVMLARALCQQPDIIVLDEPTSFLDIRYKLEFLSIIQNMSRTRHLSVIMSLHELDLAGRISDKIACVHGDRVDRFGTPEEIFAGNYVQELYGVADQSFDPVTGQIFLCTGHENTRDFKDSDIENCSSKDFCSGSQVPDPVSSQIFVIGGAGSGIPVYNRLWRENIPFAAGILQENDVEYKAAVALASEVVSEKAFYPVGQDKVQAAKQLIDSCKKCICAVEEFGPLNEANRELAEYARRIGKTGKNI